ncbi:hypothetical protein FIBSPDRAFT_862153 [Athelia psychrophila]|uniref:Secreted protein n=1 Tax=Athelia psychrophila TaxID=1759441 RepID=A0A166IL25_9AGAM|nr:hypothetical protein FIBSPDRAFT_862153 [Fibularhizoctonia sp. CBS 109695]
MRTAFALLFLLKTRSLRLSPFWYYRGALVSTWATSWVHHVPRVDSHGSVLRSTISRRYATLVKACRPAGIQHI